MSKPLIYYDEYGDWPDLKYLPDGKVKAKRWWWLPDRKKAKLLTAILNSDTFKKGLILSQHTPNSKWAAPRENKDKP